MKMSPAMPSSENARSNGIMSSSTLARSPSSFCEGAVFLRRPNAQARPQRPDFGDVPRAAGGRQRRKERPAVAPAVDALVEQRDDATIGVRADQAAETLFQRDLREGQMKVQKRVFSLRLERTGAGEHERLGGNGKWNLLENDEPERVAGDVDALPEASRRNEHGIP